MTILWITLLVLFVLPSVIYFLFMIPYAMVKERQEDRERQERQDLT